MAEKRSGSAFLTMFVPGLVIGLVVGGLAGAFLAPVMESGNLGAITQDTGAPVNRPTVRDESRGETPVAPDANPADPTTPEPEVKPEEKTDDTPKNDSPQDPAKQPG